MTYNALVPQSIDSPSLFPAQAQTNFTRLQTLVGADHQFNLTAAATDGYHNLIHLQPQAPTGALAGIGRSYSKVSAGRVHSFYMDSSGTEYQMSPSMPIRAAVNFNGVSGAVIRSQYNVSSVTRNSAGVYTINFTNAMPNANYIVQITGMRNSVDSRGWCCVFGDTVYSNSVTTTSVKINCSNKDGNSSDFLMVNVTIFSVT